MKTIYLLIFLMHSVFLFAQDSTLIDQLNQEAFEAVNKGEYKTTYRLAKKADSLSRIQNYQKGIAAADNNFGLILLQTGKYDSARIMLQRSLTRFQELKLKRHITGAINNIGMTYDYEGNYPQALKYYHKSYDMLVEMGQMEKAAMSLQNIGVVYWFQSNLPKALDYYLKALKIAESLNNKNIASDCYNNMGLIYKDLNDSEKALEYYSKALVIFKEIKNRKAEAASLQNIGLVLNTQKKFAEALRYYSESLKIREELGDKQGIANCYGNIGTVYQMQGDIPKALDYFLKSLVIRREINDKSGIATSLINLSASFVIEKEFDKALIYANEALSVAEQINSQERLKQVYENLYKIYEGKNQPALAYENYKKYIKTRDNIFNEENTKKITRAEMQFDFDKQKAIERSEQEKKDAIAEKDKQKQKVIRNSLITGFLLLSALAFFIFNAYRQKKKANIIITQQKTEVENQKTIIEKQKEIVELHQKEILDSIHYAKRIQDTILAHHEFLDQHLKNNFVLFQPKDIVSGDFYWAASAKAPSAGGNSVTDTQHSTTSFLAKAKENTQLFYLAVCDSTGHGVPGAFMSLLNIGFLSEAINEKNIYEPHHVLNYVREKLIESVSKEGQKDGFDGILMCFEMETETIKKITYSAAYNSPVLISNGNMIELDVDKMPVGIGERKESFTLRQIDFNTGDMLYLYTDGYADQFGGPKGKKFKYKQLNDILIAQAQEQCSKQKETLSQSFNDWKGNLEQVDDVCVIGIRL